MSWIVDTPLSWFQQLCVNIVKTGHVPRHVAFIMDGNRRYAKKLNVNKVEGHVKGFEKLAETLKWCKELGITEVTVYAFSIDNFKRSKDEVDALMQLAIEKFKKLLEEKTQIMDNGVCVRIIGNLSYLSAELRKLIAEVMLMTENNNKSFLNIAFAYTSREEMSNSMECIANGVRNGMLDLEDIDEQLISKCLYTNHSPDPDLLVRTSGETRFSDFLLWQISYAQVWFVDVMWPELTIWHLLAAIFKYQRHYNETESVKKTKSWLESRSTSRHSPRVVKFLDHLDHCRRKQLESYLHL